MASDKDRKGFRGLSRRMFLKAVGGAGPHRTGRAIDLRVHGSLALMVVRIALSEGFTGIGVSQKGDHTKRFIHLDDLTDVPGQPRPWIWSY